MSDYLDRMAKTIYCDTCRLVVDQDVEPGRWRHAACPPPPYPEAALKVFEQINKKRGR